MRTILYGMALTLALALAGCSGGSSDAPPTNNAHPEGWVRAHGQEALKSPYFADCQVCHGRDLRGVPGVPSCYSSSINGQSCHAGGPNIPHPLDGTYFAASAHGKDAKKDLLACQSCHGQPGGPGSNPHFNVGINDFRNTGLVANPGHGCEGCHVASAGKWLAHPRDWAGPNNTFHYSVPHAAAQASCTLCHGISLDGAGGVGVSCRNCHAETDHFALDCTSCHGYAPDGSADDYIPLGVNHRSVSTVAPHNVCVTCHGVKENTTGGYFAAVTGYRLFDKATDTPGDHWNGRINMNSDPGYNPATFGCDTALCHGGGSPYRLADSGLPVAAGSYNGLVVPHPVGSAFLAPTGHGPAAKGLTAGFPNGLLDCQPCHATAAETPPRFNVGIASAGGNGCEGCHNDRTAHPSRGTRDNYVWHDNTYRHGDASGFSAQCALCHGADLQGVAGVSPSCTSCHLADPAVYSADCISCHSAPPGGGAPVGYRTPNRTGQHQVDGHGVACSTCHQGAGFGTPRHFNGVLTLEFSGDVESMTVSPYNSGNMTCTGVCHGEAHNGYPWY